MGKDAGAWLAGDVSAITVWVVVSVMQVEDVGMHVWEAGWC